MTAGAKITFLRLTLAALSLFAYFPFWRPISLLIDRVTVGVEEG
jgi:hypothetical protein